MAQSDTVTLYSTLAVDGLAVIGDTTESVEAGGSIEVPRNRLAQVQAACPWLSTSRDTDPVTGRIAPPVPEVPMTQPQDPAAHTPEADAGNRAAADTTVAAAPPIGDEDPGLTAEDVKAEPVEPVEGTRRGRGGKPKATES